MNFAFLSPSLFFTLLKKSREIKQEKLQGLITKSMIKLAGRRVKLNFAVIVLDLLVFCFFSFLINFTL